MNATKRIWLLALDRQSEAKSTEALNNYIQNIFIAE
jgi:hypothetical protein